MIPTPLHPALVHLPLGLAFILPALTLGFAWAAWKNPLKRRSWILIVALQAVLLGAGFVAMNTGEREGERIERAVPKAAIERHEELAEQFLWATGITLVVAAGALVFRRPRAVRTLTSAAVLGTVLIAAAALRVGHAGGQLVYVHNAAAAYASENKALARVPGEQPNAVRSAGTDDDHEDKWSKRQLEHDGTVTVPLLSQSRFEAQAAQFGTVLPMEDKTSAESRRGKRLKSSRHVHSRVQNNGAHLSSGSD